MAKKTKNPKLNRKKVTLYVGKTVRLKVTGTKKKVKWSSNKKKIATVTTKGKVKAKKKGTAKITAKIGKKKLICKVTVKNKTIPNKSVPGGTTAVSSSDSSGTNMTQGAGQGTNVTATPTAPASPKVTATTAATATATAIPKVTATTAATATATVTPKVTAAATATATAAATAPIKTPNELDMSKLNWKNSTAYTGAWKGSTYSISEALNGTKVSNYTQVTVTLNLYNSDQNLIEGTDNGSASVKLSTSNKDWAGFTDINGVASGVKVVLTLDSFTGEDLYLVVQNSKASIAYIEVTSVILEKKEKANADEACSYTPLAELAQQYGFKMGTVISAKTLKNTEWQKLIEHHFNSVTASNEMKAYSLLDQKASQASADGMPAMKYETADAMMDYAKTHGLSVRGHAFVWDAGMNDWFFREGYDVNNEYADSETMKKRLQSYIEQVMTHFEEKYPGVIYCWDVVNEAIEIKTPFEENDPRYVENNIFSQRIGRDYVELSFQYAKETVEKLEQKDSRTNIKLFYNDFSTFQPTKRDAIIELIKSINQYKSDGAGGYVKLCDGIGMQSYIGGYGKQSGCMSANDITNIKTAIEMFAEAGVEVHVSELAVRNYENTEEVIQQHAAFYRQLFDTYLSINAEAKEAGKTGPITSISIWGLCDNPDLSETDYSFKMNGPYCGLFTELYAVKPSFLSVYNSLQNTNDTES